MPLADIATGVMEHKQVETLGITLMHTVSHVLVLTVYIASMDMDTDMDMDYIILSLCDARVELYMCSTLSLAMVNQSG